MKKFFSVFMVMMTVCLSACLVSCGDDEETTGGGSDKPSSNKIQVYLACVSESTLNLCDISITLHSGDKSKVVKLEKANGVQKKLNPDNPDSPILYNYVYDSVDGNKGIDYTEANATLRADAEEYVNSLSDDKEHLTYFIAVYGHSMEEFKANGGYSVNASTSTSSLDGTRSSLLQIVNGQKFYETFPRYFNLKLSMPKK